MSKKFLVLKCYVLGYNINVWKWCIFSKSTKSAKSTKSKSTKNAVSKNHLTLMTLLLIDFWRQHKKLKMLKINICRNFKLRQKKEMTDILKKYNFDIETYNQIGNTIGQNPELMNKVRQKLNK